MYPLVVAIVIISLLVLLAFAVVFKKNRGIFILLYFSKAYWEIAKKFWRKKSNKRKILKLLFQKGDLGNKELRKEINVSDTSIVNYTDELEEEGKIEQIGKAGRFVKYRLK